MRGEISKIITMIKSLRGEEDLEPTFGLVLYEDIEDSSGKVLYSKGSKINALNSRDLNVQDWLLKELKKLLVKKEEAEKKAERESSLLQDLGGLPQDLSKFAGQKK